MSSLVGKLVAYHGSKTDRHGEYTVTAEHAPYPGDQRHGDVRYELQNDRPRDSMCNVHRSSFTVIDTEQPTEVIPKTL